MINKLKQYFKKLGYMLAFAMKGGDIAVSTQDETEVGTSIVEQQETSNLGEALMKGEVTQEVKEMRYKDYAVSKESKNYTYLGGGVAIKKNTPPRNMKHYKFCQGNTLICENVGHELNRLDSYGEERYNFEIVYSDVTTIRLEAYASYGEFEINDNHIKVSLVFDKNIKTNIDPITKILLRRLKEISQYKTVYEFSRNDLCTNVSMLTFTTFKATNEDDYVRYVISGMTFDSCTELDDAFIMTYSSDSFSRVDLTAKYYNKEMVDKYNAKERKHNSITLFEQAKQEPCYCDECGREIYPYDAHITKYNFGRQLCENCIIKLKLY